MESQKKRLVSTKLRYGPGGRRCACCYKWHPRKDRKIIRRLERRVVRHSFRCRLRKEED